MVQLDLSDAMQQLLKDKHLADKTLLLIADDGGGSYSLNGGACTIGANFTIVELTQKDPDYPLVIENNAGLHLYTSKYDALFMKAGLKMDFKNYKIQLKDNTGLLDPSVKIANGAKVLAAFKKGISAHGQSC